MSKPDFSTWQRKNLEQFANDSYEEIIALRADLKAALEAYRNLNTRRKYDEVQSSNSDGTTQR
jgi:hypothetical protein